MVFQSLICTVVYNFPLYNLYNSRVEEGIELGDQIAAESDKWCQSRICHTNCIDSCAEAGERLK